MVYLIVIKGGYNMGVGTSSGVQTPTQPGVIVREGENFPPIPSRLLGLSIEALEANREQVSRALSAEIESLFPNPEIEEELENTMVVYDAAKEAVRRQKEASVLGLVLIHQ